MRTALQASRSELSAGCSPAAVPSYRIERDQPPVRRIFYHICYTACGMPGRPSPAQRSIRYQKCLLVHESSSGREAERFLCVRACDPSVR